MSSVASDSIDAEAAGIDIGGDMGRDSSKYGTTTGDLHEADSRDAGVFGAGSDTKDFSGKLEKPSDQETGNATSDGSGLSYYMPALSTD